MTTYPDFAHRSADLAAHAATEAAAYATHGDPDRHAAAWATRAATYACNAAGWTLRGTPQGSWI